MSFTDEHHEFSHHSNCIAILISRVLHVKWRQRLQASKLLGGKKRNNINTKEGTNGCESLEPQETNNNKNSSRA